jgi:ribosomal protein L11 methyltransferase
MDYYKYEIKTSQDLSEILIALLADAPFDTFEETEEGISAYLPAGDGHETEAEVLLADLLLQFEFTWTKVFIKGENWNEIWESNFQPVIVDDFCAIRADFHDPIQGVKHELIINPKMAFGTGHHETTWMCLAALEHLPVKDARLLDYGCGTGILAIMASRLGAASIEAVDIEPQSYENTLENCRINNVTNVVTRLGDITAIQGTQFDGILANINRHIILESFEQLAQLIRPGGWLLISGILIQDEKVIVEAAKAVGFATLEVKSRGNWLSIVMSDEL